MYCTVLYVQVLMDKDRFTADITDTLDRLPNQLPFSEGLNDFMLKFLRLHSSERPLTTSICLHPWLDGAIEREWVATAQKPHILLPHATSASGGMVTLLNTGSTGSAAAHHLHSHSNGSLSINTSNSNILGGGGLLAPLDAVFPTGNASAASPNKNGLTLATPLKRTSSKREKELINTMTPTATGKPTHFTFSNLAISERERHLIEMDTEKTGHCVHLPPIEPVSPTVGRFRKILQDDEGSNENSSKSK